MRLLHTPTIKLYEFSDDEIPDYAILSHTWGKEEISLHDLQEMEASELDGLEGYSKIQDCCALAFWEGYSYVWIDTCCIDKTSSAELSEAINSMYRWYQDAQICYAYLADVCTGDKGWWSDDMHLEFRESRWFTRGWTLQELLAPKNLAFYDKDWLKLGSKMTLNIQISVATDIQYDHLFDTSPASVAQKMSWASGRKTTRVEDIAYSLMGIFDVNMPLIYGEGKKAFMRLQHEIVKMSDDESIFAWSDSDLVHSGIFAQSPNAFARSGSVLQITEGHELYVRRAPCIVTNRGLAIEIRTSVESPVTSSSGPPTSFIQLNCLENTKSAINTQQVLAIEVERISTNECVRSSPCLFQLPTKEMGLYPLTLMYIRPVYILRNPHEQKLSFGIDISSLSERGFSIVGTYDCRDQRDEHFWVGSQIRKCWRITLERDQSFVALLLRSTLQVDRDLLGVILDATNSVPNVSLTLSNHHHFHREMDKYAQRYHLPKPGPSQVFKTLDNSRRVSVALRKTFGLTWEGSYFVDFTWEL